MARLKRNNSKQFTLFNQIVEFIAKKFTEKEILNL